MPKKESRILQLDLLRAVAILLVLGRHFVVPPTQAGHLAVVATLWERFGWTGVDLFFVLSGFLIGGLLYEELFSTSRLDLGRFLVRRGFKIWPSYYVFVAFLLADSYWNGAPLFPSDHGTFTAKLSALVPHLCHLQNYLGPVWLHTWSLAVEEHFYLAFPLGLLVINRLRTTPAAPSCVHVALATVLALVTCTALRILAHPVVPIDFTIHLVPTHLRIDGLLFGTSLAYLYHGKPEWFLRLKRYRVLIFVFGLVAISPMLLLSLETHPFVSIWGFSLLYLGYGCVIVAAMSLNKNSRAVEFASRWLPTRVLLLIGVSSYSIYLWHWHVARLPLLKIAARFPLKGLSPTLRWLAFTTLYVTVASLVGYVMGRLIEMPALRLRDRLFPRVSRRRARSQQEPVSQGQ